jgi:hypothetical protein
MDENEFERMKSGILPPYYPDELNPRPYENFNDYRLRVAAFEWERRRSERVFWTLFNLKRNLALIAVILGVLFVMFMAAR